MNASRNGVGGMAFTSSDPPGEAQPGVRIETLPKHRADLRAGCTKVRRRRSITLLYMTRLPRISGPVVLARAVELEADYAPSISIRASTRVLERAGGRALVHDELETLGVPAVPKTSARAACSLHPASSPGTSYEVRDVFCQIVATVVRLDIRRPPPSSARCERRPRGTVYSITCRTFSARRSPPLYSARARNSRAFSTPLTWKEVHAGVDPKDFTIVTAPERFAKWEISGRACARRSGEPRIGVQKYQAAAFETADRQARERPRNSPRRAGSKQR